MFTESQQDKIKLFAKVTKVVNICFNNCFDSTANNFNLNKLSINENNCVKNCAFKYLELNNNVEKQLIEDIKLFNKKNKDILFKKT